MTTRKVPGDLALEIVAQWQDWSKGGEDALVAIIAKSVQDRDADWQEKIESRPDMECENAKYCGECNSCIRVFEFWSRILKG